MIKTRLRIAENHMSILKSNLLHKLVTERSA